MLKMVPAVRIVISNYCLGFQSRRSFTAKIICLNLWGALNMFVRTLQYSESSKQTCKFIFDMNQLRKFRPVFELHRGLGYSNMCFSLSLPLQYAVLLVCSLIVYVDGSFYWPLFEIICRCIPRTELYRSSQAP